MDLNKCTKTDLIKIYLSVNESTITNAAVKVANEDDKTTAYAIKTVKGI